MSRPEKTGCAACTIYCVLAVLLLLSVIAGDVLLAVIVFGAILLYAVFKAGKRPKLPQHSTPATEVTIQSTAPEKQQISPEKKQNAELLLLSNFVRGNSKKDVQNREYWSGVLGESAKNVIERWINEGKLIEASLEVKIDRMFIVKQLKDLLKARGQKLSGKKNELIQRLIDHDMAAMQKLTKSLDFWVCSDEASKQVGEYLDWQRAKKHSAVQESVDLLRLGKFREALHVVNKYEFNQVFSRGVGCNWNEVNENDIAELELIFTKTPKLLANLDETKATFLRLVAAISRIWGDDRVALDYYPFHINEDNGTHLSADVVARMFNFHAKHLRDLVRFSDIGIKTVSILSASGCKTCKELEGKRYTLANCPELPYSKCTCEMGCRCCVIADF